MATTIRYRNSLFDLPPETARRLEKLAAKKGVSVETAACRLLEKALTDGTPLFDSRGAITCKHSERE